MKMLKDIEAVLAARTIEAVWAHYEARLAEAARLLCEINLGATAIGTGICADIRFRKSAIEHLGEITGYPVTAAPDPIAATSDMSAFVNTSSALKNLAVHLKKAADDLRLLNSGPRCGFNDLNVPARQAGSSIMPAKVNPVIPECVNQCCFTIFGMDVTVNWAVAEGQLQLNAFDPVMVHELLTGMALLTHAMETFRVNCVEGIEINADLGRSYAQSSPSISAALNHYIGYEHAADIAAEAVHTGRTVLEVAGERLAEWEAEDGGEGSSGRLRLTPRGRQVAQAVFAQHGHWIASLFGALDAAERTQLARLLDKVATRLE